ncbi:hypothetical protein [Thermoanaerobacter mathranii]|uniref:hypothetical protein n=1 Tax=Thermoanaerobacter mathranii TaxID=583357 RepID=UPI0001B11CCA|nr:hypothetical protein [Thermoanaerobacter mathranii]
MESEGILSNSEIEKKIKEKSRNLGNETSKRSRRLLLPGNISFGSKKVSFRN